MPRRHDARLYIAFQVDPALGSPTEGLDEAIRVSLGSDTHPVHWIVPAGGLAGADPRSLAELAGHLRPRLQGGRDRIVITGHRGAFHPLLALPDARHDLSWALRNPWKTGVADILGPAASPVAVRPPCPDWSRASLVEAYARAGQGILVLDGSETGTACFHGVEPVSGLRLVWAVTAAHAKPSRIRDAFRRPPRACLLVLDAASLTTGLARHILAELASRYRPTVHALPDLPPDPLPITLARLATDHTAPLPHTPMARHRWQTAARIHSRAGLAAQRRLDAFSCPPSGESPVPSGSIRPRRRTPSSAMPGSVTLTGEHFDALFDGGLLRALRRHDGLETPLAPVVSRVRAARGETHAVVESATSFDDRGLQGLRTVLRLADGELVVDTWFPPGVGALALEILARYPRTPEARELVPFGLCVRLADATTLTTRTSDGEPVVLDLPSRHMGSGQSVGSSFTIQGPTGALTLAYPPRTGMERRVLPWCLRKHGRERRLEMNPLGTYRPEEIPEYAGLRERVTFLIRPDTQLGAPEQPRAAFDPDLTERT